MHRVGVIILAGKMQNECFWPSYYNCDAKYEHDLIVIHRDNYNLPNNISNSYGKVLLKNKIINGIDTPHAAFGGYRFAYENYKENYDIFIFISDDVILKRDGWVLDIVSTLELHKNLGFGASQIFNGGKNYPHESHLRAPFWFAKTEALNSIEWVFENDHDGEMKIGDQLTNSGFFGVQIGNKINLAYDATELNHITQLLEKKYFIGNFPNKKHNINNYDYFLNIDNDYIISPYSHIGKQSVLYDLEPFNNLLYLPSIEIAKKYLKIKKIYNSYII